MMQMRLIQKFTILIFTGIFDRLMDRALPGKAGCWQSNSFC